MANELEQSVLKKAQAWLDGHYDEATKKQVKYLMDNDMKELVESFYKDLEFGTGGLRGIMGVGSNRMNVYTVGAATQGLANYLRKNFAGEQIRVAVGHDSRNNSRMFAERVADIFASNGFTVFLFDALRPTPELSFAIRELKCHSGVVVTASHNPKEYNGYKAYWTDGAQVTEPHDKNIIAEVAKITDVNMIQLGKNPQNITILDEKFDEIYLNKVHELSLSPESVKKHHDMKIIYTPLHGSGVRLVPESLKKFGFTNVKLVPEQAVIDGNSHFFVTLEGDGAIYDFALPDMLAIVRYKVGDAIEFSYAKPIEGADADAGDAATCEVTKFGVSRATPHGQEPVDALDADGADDAS